MKQQSDPNGAPCRSVTVRRLCVLNVVSQISQGGDVLPGMLTYDVQGHFECKMFMALITFIIAVRDA